jgi:hypothetical protein
MKTPLSHRIRFGLACVAALGLGISLRAKERKADDAVMPARADEDAPNKVSAWDAGSALNERIALRRAIAKCDDASLWAWLAVPTDELDVHDAVLEELVDRLGWRAWQHVVEMEKGKTRDYLARWFLSEFAERDPWKAYEEWKKARGSFTDADWADSAFYPITRAAAATSGEKLIEVMKEVRRDTDDNEDGLEVEFVAGFDFAAVMEYLVAERERPFVIPHGILLEWARRSPAKAAEWWESNSTFPTGRDEPSKIYAAIANWESGAESLGGMGLFSPDQVEDAWQHIGEESKGAVNAKLLETATRLSRREDYLMKVLLQTRMLEAVDASWNQVPLDERMNAKAKVKTEWMRESDKPVDQRAQERWGKMLDEAWQ